MLSKKCEECGIEITAKYKSKLDLKRFCRECGVRRGAKQKDRKVTKTCTVCGKDFKVKRSAIKRINCSWECGHRSQSKKISGEKHPRYRGNKKYILGSGDPYKAVFVNGKKFYEHRLIIEHHIGRKLERNEIVHHINENKKDNRLENLRLMTLSEHTKLHYKF